MTTVREIFGMHVQQRNQALLRISIREPDLQALKALAELRPYYCDGDIQAVHPDMPSAALDSFASTVTALPYENGAIDLEIEHLRIAGAVLTDILQSPEDYEDFDGFDEAAFGKLHDGINTCFSTIPPETQPAANGGGGMKRAP